MHQEVPAVLGVSTPIVGPGDLQWFALSWYGQSVERVCATKQLRAIAAGTLRPPLGELAGAASGHLVAVSAGIEAGAFDVVIGGPCIGDCSGFPTLEALYDVVQALESARALALPALLYVGDQEEILERGTTGRWLRLGERVERWIHGLAQVVAPPRLEVVRTSTARHHHALEAPLDALRDADPALLDAAFHLAATGARAQSEESRQVTRRVVAAHLPEVVSAHLPGLGPAPAVLMAENLQQAGVFQLARSRTRPPARLELAAHWPAPGLSSGERMFRSGGWDKAAAWDLVEVAAGERPGLSPSSRDFYSRWLDPVRRADLAQAARQAWDT